MRFGGGGRYIALYRWFLGLGWLENRVGLGDRVTLESWAWVSGFRGEERSMRWILARSHLGVEIGGVSCHVGF